MTNHGGKREGAGRKPNPESKSFQKSFKVTKEVDDYLNEVGTGIIEDVLKKTKAFKDWQRKRG